MAFVSEVRGKKKRAIGGAVAAFAALPIHFSSKESRYFSLVVVPCAAKYEVVEVPRFVEKLM